MNAKNYTEYAELNMDMLRACEEVLDGKTENDKPSVSKFAMRPGMGNVKMTEHVCGSVMLVYDANTL